MYNIGRSMIRKDAIEKVTGTAKYTADLITADSLHAKLVTSPFAHALVKKIDISAASRITGVQAILTGKEAHTLTGEQIKDRPILAVDRVRYNGEPVAVVIADTLAIAKRAADLIKVSYTPLPVVHSPSQAYQEDAPLVHENLGQYEKIADVYPIPGTNICNVTKIRKGNMEQGWNASAVTAETKISFPPSDHCAIETRSVSAEVLPDGHIIIYSSSQVPFTIKKLFNNIFGIDQGRMTVHTPLVGGAYGGKSAVQLEFIAYLASRAVGGQKVQLTNSREEDFITSPVHIGLGETRR